MAQKHSIPHFKRLIVDSKIPEGQGCGNIRSLPRPLLLKSEFFTKSGRGRPMIMPLPKSSGFRMSTIRAFKYKWLVFLLFLVISKFDEN